ncbi:fused DSP-PTPase phosphatase/NAD kinase-like protein [Singulisphaera rosea]
MVQREGPPIRRRRRLAILGGSFLVVIAALAVTFRNPLLHGNFGVVEADRVLRSAQPQENLRTLVDTYKVASILNLRGGSQADSFYANEVRLVEEARIDFYDFPISATRRPTRQELLRLIDLFGRCRYPLLIHCKSGSDRTGLASGLYLMCQAGKSPKEALGAFSTYYGHVAFGGTERLHEPFVEYDRWLEGQHLAHNPERLKAWVENSYKSEDPAKPLVPLPAGPRLRFSRVSAR